MNGDALLKIEKGITNFYELRANNFCKESVYLEFHEASGYDLEIYDYGIQYE